MSSAPLRRTTSPLAAAPRINSVYNGHPGQDERDSATWARTHLLRANIPEPHATRVESLILATATHTAPPGDLVAAAHLDDPTWRTGRTTVLRNLLSRQPLYTTPAARTRWEAGAKANLRRELDQA